MDESYFIKVTKSSRTMMEAARKLGLPFTTFIDRAKKLGIYSPNQGGRGTEKISPNNKFELEDILEGKHPSYQSAKLRKRLIKEGYFPYKCFICQIDNWLEKPLTLELDHINGISTDHRLINLRLLCPNCHSQTETYSGLNKKLLRLAKQKNLE